MVVERDARLVVAISDGAGGTGGGSEAAEAVVGLTAAIGPTANWSAFWVQQLTDLDAALSVSPHGGQATAIVLEIVEGVIGGASVGDSCAWIVSDSAVVDLTCDQIRKPLVGSGRARPVGFGPLSAQGRVLVASDGLFKYAPQDAIVAAARHPDKNAAVEKLLSLVRLPSGGYQDDLAVALCEIRLSL